MQTHKKLLLVLLSMLFLTPLSIAASGGYSTASTQTATAEELLSTQVSVSRLSPFTVVDDLTHDAGVDSVVSHVAAYRGSHPGNIVVTDLVRYLSDHYSVITTPLVSGPIYRYEVGPDGEIHKVCLAVPTIEIEDGSPEPVVITIRLLTAL